MAAVSCGAEHGVDDGFVTSGADRGKGPVDARTVRTSQLRDIVDGKDETLLRSS